jgi:hypothetical protein
MNSPRNYGQLFEVIGCWVGIYVVSYFGRPWRENEVLFFVTAFGVTLCWARLGSLIEVGKDGIDLMKDCRDTLKQCHSVLEDMAAKGSEDDGDQEDTFT